MVERGIDALVVIGGASQLSGANLSARMVGACWPNRLLREISLVVAADHLRRLVGRVGSIDNDIRDRHYDRRRHCLHRIVAAWMRCAAPRSATSDIVVEVMGRQSGDLAPDGSRRARRTDR